MSTVPCCRNCNVSPTFIVACNVNVVNALHRGVGEICVGACGQFSCCWRRHTRRDFNPRDKITFDTKNEKRQYSRDARAALFHNCSLQMKKTIARICIQQKYLHTKYFEVVVFHGMAVRSSETGCCWRSLRCGRTCTLTHNTLTHTRTQVPLRRLPPRRSWVEKAFWY